MRRHGPWIDFEATALEELRSNEDLVVKDGVNRIRMLGSLRAGNDCLKCHSVKRGHLLGAFSYEVVREGPVQQAEEQLPPQA